MTAVSVQNLLPFAWLSMGLALMTIGLKVLAYFATGSVGLLSDALESVANLATAIMMMLLLRVAARPPDDEHNYGHEKAEYFSSGAEGGIILVAAVMIGFVGLQRLIEPQPLERLDMGFAITLLAAALNLAGAKILRRASRRSGSIALEAQSRHLMVDVWTSAGVLLGVGVVAATGWLLLDPLIALGICAHVMWIGKKLVRRSILGLMDTGLPEPKLQIIRDILEPYRCDGVQYHALRTRQAGSRVFVSVHIQVPGDWTVLRGHDLLEQIEKEIRSAVSPVTLLTHLEPLEDPTSWHDLGLDR